MQPESNLRCSWACISSTVNLLLARRNVPMVNDYHSSGPIWNLISNRLLPAFFPIVHTPSRIVPGFYFSTNRRASILQITGVVHNIRGKIVVIGCKQSNCKKQKKRTNTTGIIPVASVLCKTYFSFSLRSLHSLGTSFSNFS